ncbi:MAG: hypothetical protein ACKVIY_11395, partial [Acidimicrobiales bacterium]
MQPVLVIALLIAVFMTACLGTVIASYIGRSRHDAQVASVVQQVVNTAGESFDSRLQTGTAELEHRRAAIDVRMDGAQKHLDERLGAIVSSLETKVDSVDKLVAERVGGLS